MKKILVPIDGSEYSERALMKAKEFAGAFDDSQVILLNIMNMESTVANLRYASIEAVLDWPELMEEAQEKSNKLLEESKKTFSDMPNQVETVMVNEPTGNIARAIADYANDNDLDIIIMGSNGMGSLKQRLYLGSVTNKVLHLTTKPILVIQ